MEISLEQNTSLKEILKMLMNRGVQNPDFKKIKFRADEGGYGVALMVSYESDSDPWEEY